MSTLTSDAERPMQREIPGLDIPGVHPPALSFPRAAMIFGATLIGQLWLLRLSFQLDDYGLLVDPLSLVSATETERGMTARLMRWPLLWLLGALRAVAPEPLVPLHFHAVGLALHAFAAVLLARTVARFETSLQIPGAAVLSGMLFGLAGGHIQAVSWTAAWASMLYPLLGLLALDQFLSSRAWNGSGRRRFTAGVFLYLALVCKAPAVVMSGGMALLLLGLGLGAKGRYGGARHLRGEALTFVFFGGLALLSRYLTYGTLELSYYDRGSPGSGEVLASIPRGFAALGQSLVPWNAHELFGGNEPLSVSFTGGALSGPVLGALLFLPCLALAVLRARGLRGPMLLLGATLALCVIPAGLVYQGANSNLVGRTTYLPMFLTAAMLGMGTAGLAVRSRAIGSVVGLWLLALTLDGNLHVARTERLAGEHRAHAIGLVHAVAAEQEATQSGADLAVLVVEEEPGYGSIPCFGSRLANALRPPFVAAPGWQAHVFRSGPDLLERTSELELAAMEVVVLGPALDETSRPLTSAGEGGGGDGGHMRERRAWRRLSAPFTGFVPAPGASDLFAPSSPASPGRRRWTTSRPIQPHVARTLVFDLGGEPLPEEPILDGTLWVERMEGPDLSFPIRAELGGARHVTLELGVQAEDLFGPAWRGLRWESGATDLLPRDVTTRVKLPELEFIGVRDPSELALGSGRIPRPRLVFALPSDATAGERARLSWNFATRGVRMRLFAEADVTLRKGRFEFAPKEVQLDGLSSQKYPWGEFCRRFLIPLHEQRGGADLELECRLVLLLEQGQATGRSPVFALRFTEPGPGA